MEIWSKFSLCSGDNGLPETFTYSEGTRLKGCDRAKDTIKKN
jgi:hypothetical protein